MKKGKFIVFEGVDFSGKSTQVELMRKYILEQGLQDKFLFTKEPGGHLTDSGPKIRDILLRSPDKINPTAEVLLFSADRSIHVQKIKAILKSGTNIICDRYFYSTIAYQTYAGGFDRELLFDITSKAIDGLVPDILFVLNMGIETYKKRRDSEKHLDRIESNIDEEYFASVSRGYNEMFDMFELAYPNFLPANIVSIDASRGVADIHKIVKKAIVNFI